MDMDKLKEMFKMIDNEEREKPSEKFKNYLSSLPVELVRKVMIWPSELGNLI